MPTFTTLVCENCTNKFEKSLKSYNFHKKRKNTFFFCSPRCHHDHRTTISTKTIECTNCDKSFQKSLSQIKRSKSGNHFCSNPCSATYNNKHKKHGTRRSKLEVWLEQELIKLYPNYNILFNDKSSIKSELDIFFPDLKLAIEINGIFHYKPIYGEDKLKKIQDNDKKKAVLCEEHGILLHSIDASKLKTFTEQKAVLYLEIIMERLRGFEPPTLRLEISCSSC